MSIQNINTPTGYSITYCSRKEKGNYEIATHLFCQNTNLAPQSQLDPTRISVTKASNFDDFDLFIQNMITKYDTNPKKRSRETDEVNLSFIRNEKSTSLKKHNKNKEDSKEYCITYCKESGSNERPVNSSLTSENESYISKTNQDYKTQMYDLIYPLVSNFSFEVIESVYKPLWGISKGEFIKECYNYNKIYHELRIYTYTELINYYFKSDKVNYHYIKRIMEHISRNNDLHFNNINLRSVY